MDKIEDIKALMFNSAPDWAKWVAMDENGLWHYYQIKPQKKNGEWHVPLFNHINSNVCDVQPHTSLSWNHSLIAR